ncbi:molybdate ABC transporter permease subunit [Psychrobium sp. MM17-31]|uniref:molybdate ABC transporter permease subunit n=1 Tax=Psychrobium sp. MM17-31 TaxID=2917758 RepID=UPI001EF40B02|nr:molybdate ABC transporter permease subunit [Psychrobium sp. MM17-31]MCG7532874.1 molybdate ABC transporter permease subunit [Psychrobium sp. MM17-31]
MTNDLQALWLTLKLAFLTTIILLTISPFIAWWLAKSKSKTRPFFEALVALPLVLPPTVLGFYLLLAFSPNYLPGQLWQSMTGTTLAFSFSGLLIGSIIYSLPFVVQPLQAGFVTLGNKELEAAKTLGMSRWQTIKHIIVPMTKRSFLLAAVMGFAHTLGEFGVVLMIGGNIPGETQVLAISLFEHVEAFEYQQAHTIAGGLLISSLVMLVLIYAFLQNKDAKP